MPERPQLAELIDMQIRQHGPMSVATYMGLALTHPRHGYYKQAAAIGAAGDFITAPEISQMFGEIIGFFLVNLWQQMSEPQAFTLLELGPGRGTLMADILRVASRAPGFAEAVTLELFETDPELLNLQRQRLAECDPDGRREAAGDRFRPEQDDVDAAVGLTGRAKRAADLPSQVLGGPGLRPGAHAVFEFGDDGVGDPAVDIRA